MKDGSTGSGPRRDLRDPGVEPVLGRAADVSPLGPSEDLRGLVESDPDPRSKSEASERSSRRCQTQRPDARGPEEQRGSGRREGVAELPGVAVLTVGTPVRYPLEGSGSGSGQLSLLGGPEFGADPVTPPPEPTDVDEAYAAQQAAIARRIDATKVPDRAFSAADWMRAYVIATYPSAAVARAPWGSAKQGMRLVWAKELAVIAEPKPLGRDARTWAEVWHAMKWLYEEQSSEYRIIVQSPTTLREKWGRIQEARRRAEYDRKRKPPASAAVARRTFTSWNEGWDDNKSGGDRG